MGPVLGGLLLERFWWGSVFLMAVPVMLLLLILGPRVLPEYRDAEAGTLDLASAGMSLGAVLAPVFGLKELAVGGSAILAAISIVAGAVLGLAFWKRQRRLADPLIDPGLFRSRVFNVSLLTNLFGIFVAFGYFLFVAQYLQLVLGLSPQTAGLWSLPSAAGFIVGANVAPKYIHRFRPAYVLAPALVVVAVGLAAFTTAGTEHGLALAVTASVIISLALAPIVNLTTELIVGSAPPEKAGGASGISETAAELGGALGIAVLGSIGTAVYRANLASSLPAGLTARTGESALESLGGAIETASGLGSGAGASLVDAARTAFVNGLGVTTGMTALIALMAAVVIAVLLRRVEARDQDPVSDEPQNSTTQDQPAALGESPAA